MSNRKLKRIPNIIATIIYVISGLAFIGLACGVDEATSVLNVFRNMVFAIIAAFIFVKMHNILRTYGR